MDDVNAAGVLLGLREFLNDEHLKLGVGLFVQTIFMSKIFFGMEFPIQFQGV